MLEAIVFVESAGRPDVIAGNDPADAAGLTQILAQTGQSLLGMHIDLAASRKLTAEINRRLGQRPARARRPGWSAAGRADRRPLQPAAGARRDRALPAARPAPVRAPGPRDRVLPHGDRQPAARAGLYDGGTPVPYAQLYFDTAPIATRAAFNMLAGFGDDSSLYYWRILGAAQIMRLYRQRPLGAGAARFAAGEPRARRPRCCTRPTRTSAFADPDALYDAYAEHAAGAAALQRLAAWGSAYAAGIGADGQAARRSPRPCTAGCGRRRSTSWSSSRRGCGRCRAAAQPLIVSSAVTDARYQQQLGGGGPHGRRRATRSRSPGVTSTARRRPRSRRCSTVCRRST